MPWNSISPDGTKSVKTNTPLMAQNTVYTEQTMNKDHFWNKGANQDGRHNVINMPTQGSFPAISTGMSGNIYLKSTQANPSTVQGYFSNADSTYQFIPRFVSGTIDLSGTGNTFVTLITVPNNVYGDIYMFSQNAVENMARGFFKCDNNICQAYTCLTLFDNSGTTSSNLRFGNGASSSGLNLRVAVTSGTNEVYAYRVVYWGITT